MKVAIVLFLLSVHGVVTKTATNNQGYYLGAVGGLCPVEHTIMNQEECEVAHTQLGLNQDIPYIGSTGSIPPGCSTRQTGSHNLHFNTRDAGSGRSDMTPVCFAAEPEIGHCPWMDGDSGVANALQCMDSSLCFVTADLGTYDGWSCCEERSGRARCPTNFPHMCARSSSCANGTEHCCVYEPADCDATEGGLRSCFSQVEVEPSSLNFTVEAGSNSSIHVIHVHNNDTDDATVSFSFMQAPTPSFTRVSNKSSSDAKFAENRVLFRVNEAGVDVTVLNAIGIQSVRILSSVGLQIGELSDSSDVLQVVKALNENPNVIFAEPDYLVYADDIIPNDPRYSELWGMHNPNDHDIDADEAWAIHKGLGRRVIVAVIDTGVDYNHQDLREQMWVNEGEIPGNGVDDDDNGYVDDVYGANFISGSGNPMDDNGHGTHCAGTIGAAGDNNVGVVGVTWGPRIMALKFLSAGGSGSISDAIEAVNYAVMMGAHLTSNSWGGGGASQAMEQAIIAAHEAGQLFIAAAGNSNSDNDVRPHYPSNYQVPNVMSIAATTITDDRASFSCYGRNTVHIGAPGHNILSTLPRNRYASYSGTSMATPHVAGLAALLLDYAPSMTNMQVKTVILESGDQIAALQGKTTTGARINAARALEMAARYGVFRVNGPSTRTIPAGATEELQIQVGGPDIREGDYAAQLAVTGAHWRIEATRLSLNVFGFPSLHLPSPNVNFGQVALNTRVRKSLVVQNTGNGAGTLLSLTVDDVDGWSWELSDTDFFPHRLLAGEEVAIEFIGQPSSLGPNTAIVTLFTDDENATTLTSQFYGEGVQPANLVMNPPSLDLIGTAEDPVLNGSFILSNTGGLAARYDAQLEGQDYVLSHNQGENELPYDWIEVNETGQRIQSLNDVDDGSAAIDLPFAFPFLGRRFTRVFVSSNGFITFEQAGSSSYQPAIPSARAPNFVIAPYWTDLRLRNSANSAVFHKAIELNGTNAVVIEWANVTLYRDANIKNTFEVILLENGNLKMMLQQVAGESHTGSLAIGYDGSDGSIGEDVSSQVRSASTNVSMLLSRPLMISGNVSGILQPGETATISAQVFPEAMSEPIMMRNIILHSEDSNQIPLPIQSLVVTADVRNVSRTTSTTTTSTTTTTTSTTRVCPWTDGHSGEDMVLECIDGTRCVAFREVGELEGWSCCASHGGRARCPRSLPFMCARPNSCADGTAHCCAMHESDCDATEGGLRGCDEERLPSGSRRLRGVPVFMV